MMILHTPWIRNKSLPYNSLLTNDNSRIHSHSIACGVCRLHVPNMKMSQIFKCSKYENPSKLDIKRRQCLQSVPILFMMIVLKLVYAQYISDLNLSFKNNHLKFWPVRCMLATQAIEPDYST